MTPQNKKPLIVEFYKERRFGRWSWRLMSANGTNWSSPSKGFYDLRNAKRSFWRMVAELDGSVERITEKVIER